MEKTVDLLKKLDFEGCIELYDKLERGHPMIDLVFDRMEEIDPDKFEKFLDNEM